MLATAQVGCTPSDVVRVTRSVPSAVCAVAALGLTASLVGGIGGPAQAATSSTRPFSDPVWWPLRTPSEVDCTTRNPGCSKHHHFYGVDVLSRGADKKWIHDAGVFSMGHGIAHIGDAVGRACPKSPDAEYSSTTFGKWVWVDHGAGVISRYAHLSSIAVKEGQRVSPATRLGTVGNTGVATYKSCSISYVTFGLKKPGIYGPSEGLEFSTVGVGTRDGKVLACDGDRRRTWPTDLSVAGSPTRMEDVPKGTVIPGSNRSCAADVPATAAKPSGVTLATAGAGSLKARWTKAPAGVDRVRLELGEYHPTTSSWDKEKRERWKDVSASTTSYTYSDLTNRKLWRVRVWFHTKAGWSAASSWVEKKTT